MKIRSSIKIKCNNFKEAMRKCTNDQDLRSLVIMYKRWLCMNDLFFLTCVTGHEKIAQWREFYEPFCDEVSLMNWKVVQIYPTEHKPSEGMLKIRHVVDSEDELKMERMSLCYRGFYKTTVITIVHSAQLLLNFPNIHIVLCHNKQRTSSDNLVAVKNLFLNEPKWSDDMAAMLKKQYGVGPTALRKLFPECIPDGKEWGSAEKFSLANRTDMQRPEDSVEAVGVDTEITGGHWQVAKKNDLVTEKSVNTEDQIKKTLDWDARFNKGHFDDLKYPLQDYEGTRYHHVDMYSVKKNDSRIHYKEIAIVKDLEKFKAGDDSQITHPKRYSRKDIENLMQDDMWVFMCQLMLDPNDPSQMRFDPSMIKYYTEIPEQCNYYLLVDPASAQKKKSDYTAMMVVGVINKDGKKCKYVVDGVRDRLNAGQRIDSAIELCKRWNIGLIAWEAIGFQNTDCYNFEERRRKENMKVSIEEIKSQVGAKEDRIRGLIPEYTNGEWFWPEKGKLRKNSYFDGKSYDLTEDFELEMTQFPLSAHDDILEVGTFLNRLEIVPPKYKEKEKKIEGMTFKDLHEICDAGRIKRRDIFSGAIPSYV